MTFQTCNIYSVSRSTIYRGILLFLLFFLLFFSYFYFFCIYIDTFTVCLVEDDAVLCLYKILQACMSTVYDAYVFYILSEASRQLSSACPDAQRL